MSVQNPFTPGSGLFPPHFADREREIRGFHERFQATLDGRPRHMALLGDFGLGKTALLLQFRRMANERGGVVSLGLANLVDSSESFLGWIVGTFALQIRASHGETAWKRLARALGLPEASGTALKAALHRDFATMRDAQTSLRHYLRVLWTQIRHQAPALLIMIDDVELLQRSRDTLTVLREALADLGAERVNVMAVVSGQSAPGAPFAQDPTLLDECFEPFQLRRLPDDAVDDALVTPIAGTPVRLDRKVADRIVELAAGHPAYLQELAYHAVEMADPNHRVTPETFELALEQTFYRISTTLFEPQMASLSAPEQTVLALLAQADAPISPTEIRQALARQARIDPDALPDLLADLEAKGCIDRTTKGTADGSYRIPDPLFREYVRRHLDWMS